eukprot:m51a1_g12561 hypothetical protein (593) ;mRNA; f:1608-3926
MEKKTPYVFDLWGLINKARAAVGITVTPPDPASPRGAAPTTACNPSSACTSDAAKMLSLLRAPRAVSFDGGAGSTITTRVSFEGSDVPIFTRSSWEAGGFATRNYKDNQDISDSVLQTWEDVAIPEEPEEASKVLKVLIRRGVPDRLRRTVWGTITGAILALENDPGLYGRDIRITFGPRGPPRQIQMPPLFGGKFAPEDHYICQMGIEAAKRILCTLASVNADFHFSPRVTDLLLVLLCFMPESETYATMKAIIARSRGRSSFLENDKKSTLVFCATFETVLSRKIPQVYKRGVELGVKWADLAYNWSTRLYVGILPYPAVLRIVDCFLNEGNKILHRTGLGLLWLARHELLSEGVTTQQSFLATLARFAQKQDSTSVIKEGFRFVVKRSDFERISKQHCPRIVVTDPGIQIYYRPKLAEASEIISDVDLELLWSFLPKRFAVMDPRVLFRSSKSGYNLRTMLKSAHCSPVILLAKTAYGSVAGCYINAELAEARPQQFCGDGECFLFTLKPVAKYYGATIKDSFYVLVESDKDGIDGLSLGAGAFRLSNDLSLSSAPTATYGNQGPLVPDEGITSSSGVECVSVELYTVE